MCQYTVKDTINGIVQKVKIEFKSSCEQISRTVIVKSKQAPKISFKEKKNKKRKKRKKPAGINQCNTADFTKLQVVIFI